MIYLQDADFTLHNGDVLDVLREMPDESVDCVVTSPPYWGLRDYGTGAWEGGDPDCGHRKKDPVVAARKSTLGPNADGLGPGNQAHNVGAQYGESCGKCGAHRIDNQLGLEPTPEQYVERMTEVFREVRRVLAAHGTCWLNMGDSYAGSWGNQGRKDERGTQRPVNGGMLTPVHDGRYPDAGSNTGAWVNDHPSLKPKDLCGIPWRLAFALQADGWYLRSDIVWSKLNPMPESVTDRPTKAHEYVFLLTKSPRYFFDQEAVREPHDTDGRGGFSNKATAKWARGVMPNGAPLTSQVDAVVNPAGRNIRSVWEIATQPYPNAHFATFPEELVRRCLLAGTSERGVCPECRAPWERRPKTLGWYPTCAHYGVQVIYDDDIPMGEIAVELVPIPATVLDPFMGSGTTALVARKHARRAVGIELNAEYCALAAHRLQQLSLFAEMV